MASEQPQEFITNAFVQAVAYRGTERNAAYQADARDIQGPLDAQIAEAYRFVAKNMKVYALKEPARRDISQYAMQAVFEAVVNAVAHRDYSIQSSKVRLHMFSDRLEIFFARYDCEHDDDREPASATGGPQRAADQPACPLLHIF